MPPSRRVDLRKHFVEGVEEGDLPQFQVVADLEPALEDRVEQVVLGEVGHAEVVEGGLQSFGPVFVRNLGFARPVDQRAQVIVERGVEITGAALHPLEECVVRQ